MRWAFSDESRRGNTYVVAAVVVETHEVNAVRTELRRFLRRNQRRVHMSKENPARRNQFLAMVEHRLPALAVVVPIDAGMHVARARALEAMTGLLVAEAVATWHLEWMTEDVQNADRRTIAAALDVAGAPDDFMYDHRSPSGDPLLWAADAVAWASSRHPLDWVATTTLT